MSRIPPGQLNRPVETEAEKLRHCSYFDRVESMLRRSIGVSLSAKGSANFRPAPPTAMGPLDEEGVAGETEEDPLGDAEWLDWKSVKDQLPRDEL